MHEQGASTAAGTSPGPCWSRIGVWGAEQPRCPLLAEAVHCRNCAVYAEAGQELLERPLPEGYAENWSAALAQPPQPRGAAAASALVFRIGDAWLALPTSMVREVAPMRAPRRIPHRSGHVIYGLVNVRGELLPCASLGRLFSAGKGRDGGGRDRSKRSFAERLIVIEDAGRRFVFPVSEVDGILRYAPADVGAVPATLDTAGRSFVCGIVAAGGRHVGCLDGGRLFDALDRCLT